MLEYKIEKFYYEDFSIEGYIESLWGKVYFYREGDTMKKKVLSTNSIGINLDKRKNPLPKGTRYHATSNPGYIRPENISPNLRKKASIKSK